MLQAVNLTKRYEDGLLALDGLNLTVQPGELFCLLGANGAGKTTAVNLFLNFIEPTAGQALVEGIDAAVEPLEAKKHIAYVSENVMLYDNFTARQNLEFFGTLGGRRGLTRDECYAALRRVGLEEKAWEQRLKLFSKGMRQKTGIAIAILKGAPNIILDEPTSGLDPKAAAEFMDLLAQLRAEGKAILMSTHDIFRAKEAADRVGIMQAGRLLVTRTRAELAADDLEELYLRYMDAAGGELEAA
ncbi:MAG: ABC transporter ATP-binding protein [Gemmatimonadetes bacterium RBG_16_66_8]|nr:MAG: ABC transporter ATP-binding protein [Gemmatimonadetes bacterium RBG_16_66_8]